MSHLDFPRSIHSILQEGVVIPAVPLALDAHRRMDESRQRAVIRYYMDAGAGGLAVGVHTTQFEIRLPEINLLKPVLQVAAEECDSYENNTGRPVIRIAGAIGKTRQAVAEAELAAKLGYHAVLLSLAAFSGVANHDILEHCRTVAKKIPIVGFYLQPAVGGRILDVNFWREFARIEKVIAIKIAPFNRYQTLDVVRGVAESGRGEQIALYTGNDDNILADLLSEYRIRVNDMSVTKRIVGGLLGHWAVWTRRAVQLLNATHGLHINYPGEQTDTYTGVGDNPFPEIFEGTWQDILALANQITDSNAAFFDAANRFSGCIAGIHEVLFRQGLFENIYTLNPAETLSPGQKQEIDRIYAAYPHLNDDKFVKENLNKWLS